MTSRIKALFLAAAVVLLVAALVASQTRGDPDVPVFSYVGTPATRASLAPLETGGFHLVEIVSTGEPTLVGLVKRPEGDAEPRWLVHFPGNGEAALAEAKTVFDALALDAQWGILTVAPRGFDASEGTPSVEGLHRDADRVLTYAAETLGVHLDTAILTGFSLGAYFALRAARAHPPRGLILWAPFSEVDIAAPGPLSRFRPFQRYTTTDFLPAPIDDVLLISATRDSALEPRHAQRVADGLQAQRWIKVEADHTDVGTHPAAVTAARDYLEACLAR